MLLRFSVENSTSFYQTAELSMLATRFRDAPDHRLPTPGTNHGTLPVMAIYGANASGKSNLLQAMWIMRDEVVRSYADRKPGERMNHQGFALEPGAMSQPTRMEVDFLLDGVRYHYGFLYNAQRVIQEWLYAWPEGRQQRWFIRELDDEDSSEPHYSFTFGARFRGRKSLIADLTRPNSLFLSAGAQHNHDQLSPLYRWFARGLQRMEVLRSPELPLFEPSATLLQPQHAQVVRALLSRADIGVSDFRIREDRDIIDRHRQQGGVVSSELLQRFKHSPPLTIELAHETSTGQPIFLSPEQESHGTQLLLRHSERVLSALSEGACLIVDELDASLHPRLSAALLGLFTSPEANPNGAQLIFTTHDQSLLSHLRRDSVVFVEKDRTGSSSIVPLSDFQTRAHHNIQLGYAEGRFGGVPMIGDLTEALTAVSEE